MNKLSMLALSLGVASLAAPRASADTLAFASLPTGQVTQHPAGDAPKNIGAAEKVPGFYVARPPAERGDPVPIVSIFADEQDARAYAQGKPVGSAFESRADTCFAEHAIDLDLDDEKTGPAEWSPSLEPVVQLAPHFVRSPARASTKPRKKKRKASFADLPRTFEVVAVHQERVVDAGGKVQLEMTDAWVDPASGGARLVGKAVLPLQKIGDAPGGITLYAARERTHVQVVVRRPRAEAEPIGGSPDMAQLRRAQIAQTPFILESSNGSQDASTCGFARMTLHGEQGVGEMAHIETQIAVDAPPEEQPPKKESALQAMLGDGDAAQDLTLPELRVRPLAINASATWLSRDKEPVISVTMGWAGRGRKM